jgi:hypothetical protein
MTENLHQTLPAILKQLFHNPPISHVVLAPECGGRHRIQLFSSGAKSRATNYRWPDAAIILNGNVRVILEIEQAGIVSPGRIGSKLVPATLSTYLCNEEIGRSPLSISRETALIQVVNTACLRPATRKIIQYRNLEGGIRNLLPLGCIRHYLLFPVVGEDTPPFDAGKYDDILWAIHGLLLRS